MVVFVARYYVFLLFCDIWEDLGGIFVVYWW